MTNSPSTDATRWIARDQQAVEHPGGGGGDNTIVLSHGIGARVWDIEGREYLDAQGGAWLNKVGYGRKELADVAARQMEQLSHFAFGFDYTNIPAIEFAEKLIARAPPNIVKVRLATGGGEANDHALQIARLYHHQKGNPARRKILVHREAYHGGTSGGAELDGGSRSAVASKSDDIIFLTAPRPYHIERFGNRDMTAFCVDELKAVISEHGAENIAAMFAELAVGFGGMIPLPQGYWSAMTAVLKAHGILFVADEVVTAFGRTGAWFLSNDYSLTPDLIVLAKGITSGYMPMAAVLLGSDVAEATKGLGPGNSYAGHAVGCAVGSAHIDIIERENLLENSQARGVQALRELRPLLEHPLVGDIRGRGLMIGIELVTDKDSRTPLTRIAARLNGEFPRYMRRKHGILLSLRNSAVLLTPPLIIMPDDVTRICHALVEAIGEIDLDDYSRDGSVAHIG